MKFSKGGRIVYEVNTGFSTRGENGVWTDMIKVRNAGPSIVWGDLGC